MRFISLFFCLLFFGCAHTKLEVVGGNIEQKTLDLKTKIDFNKHSKLLPVVSIKRSTGLDLKARDAYFEFEWKIDNIW